MRHTWSISDSPDLPIRAFRKALGKNRPDTLEGGKGGAPSTPDPYNTANVQNRLNQQSAAYNKALNLNNYSNPFGSQTSNVSGYDPTTGAPIYQTSIQADPRLQWLLNQQIGNLGAIPDANQSAISGLQGLNQQYSQLNSQLGGMNAANAMGTGQDAYYKAATSYLDPQFSQNQESLEAKLAAQGLASGSQAYGNAMGNFQRDKAFAYNQAANSAITQGQQLGLNQLQAQQGLLGQQAQNLGAQSGLFGQQLAANQLGYQNLHSVAGLIPGYSGTGQAGTNPFDIGQALQNQYLGNLGLYNSRQQSSNATASNLAGLFGNLSRANSLSNMFSGNGLSSYGNMLSSVSPGLAGSLGDSLGMSIGGVYGPETQAGLDALIGSFNGGTSAAAAGGAAEAGAAGAAEAGAAGAGTAGAGAVGGEGAAGAGFGGAAGLVALPFAIAIGGMLNGIFGPPDGPGQSNRDIANTYGNLGLSYTFDGKPLWQQLGLFGDYANMPGFANNTMNQAGSMDMQHQYYGQDSGPVAAYLASKYGAPNQTTLAQGLGGYTDPQYADASNYFQNANVQLGDWNPYLGGYSPGWNSNGGG